MTLEEQFNKVAEQANKEIQAKLAEANELIQEAVEISEATGVPFHADVSPLSQPYVPTTIRDKWAGLFNSEDDEEEIDELNGVGMYTINDCEGWKHSDVCY